MVLRKMSRIEKVWRIGTMLFLVCIGKVEKGLCDLGFYWSPGISCNLAASNAYGSGTGFIILTIGLISFFSLLVNTEKR